MAIPRHEALSAAATANELRLRSLELLEFPRVREALAAHTRLPLARELALGLVPAYDVEAVAHRQQETSEALLLLEHGADADLATERDVRPVMERAAKGGVLTGEELLALADTLALVQRAKAAGGRLAARTPVLRPGLHGQWIAGRFEHHLLVVSQQCHETTGAGKPDQPVDHAAGIGPTIDVISQRDD